MDCPACARPIAMARPNCVYCGAALSTEVLEAAALAAERVLKSKSLDHLEAAARAFGRELQIRRYVVVDTTATSVETLAAACSVSLWEARQWQTASRYRLVKVSTEPADGPLEVGLRRKGLTLLIVSEAAVAQSRQPILIESMDLTSTPPRCAIRDGLEGSSVRKELPEADLALLVSASIKREKVKEQPALRTPVDTRLEDAWLVHLHLRSESRPWEIDPRRTAFEGAGLASAHMRTLELVRRLAAKIPHDEAFRNIVPALSPGVDPLTEFSSFRSKTKGASKEPKVVVLDNALQFREYSAWRGAIETGRHEVLRPQG